MGRNRDGDRERVMVKKFFFSMVVAIGHYLNKTNVGNVPLIQYNAHRSHTQRFK